MERRAEAAVTDHDGYLKYVIARYGTLHVERVLNEVKAINEVPMRPRIGPAKQGERVHERRPRASALWYCRMNCGWN